MDLTDAKMFRRAELLARLELLDQLIAEQANRAAIARSMGWEMQPYDERTRLLAVSRERCVHLFKVLMRESSDGPNEPD